MDFKKFEGQSASTIIGAVIVAIAGWFASAAFIWWGWNIFAWHFNLPQFGYMEIFAMRMALSSLFKILWQK
jgi:hypothetical protein